MSENLFEDPVFFHKSMVEIGTKFVHYGRKNPLSTWEVTKITSWFTTNKPGIFKPKSIKEIRHLDDDIILQNVDTGEEKKATFGYLSYSAIWRLAKV